MKKILALATVVVICFLGAQTFAADAAESKGKEPAAEKEAPKAADTKSPSKTEAPAGAHEAHSSESTPAKCPICPVRSPEELDVLMTLRERAAEVDAREAVVQRREKALAELEKSIDSQVAKLDAKVAGLEKRLDMGEPGRAEREQRIKTLVETLTGLTPKKVAPILAETDPEVAATLLRRMDASKAAALLAIMPASKAGQFISMGIGKKSSAAMGDSPAAPSTQEVAP